ncbi:MAG: STAS domain-containing protein [Deltaproteobacteria bacterium]|nr:STAS domain-containing protein [Deltaproteobacteria bacterium]
MKNDTQNNSEQDDQKKIGGMKKGGRTVLSPKNSITYESCQEIKDLIDEQIGQHKTEIILDCKAVPFLDSAALELLLQTHNELRVQGGALKISGLNPVCRDILVATRLINALYVYEDVHKATMGRP